MKIMRLSPALAAAFLCSLTFSTCATAAPYDVLHVDDDAVAAVDRATVRKQGLIVRYEVVTILRIPPELAGTPDEIHHWKETDCKARSTRILRMASRGSGGQLETPPWAEGEQDPTEIDPAEHRVFCEQGKYLATLLHVDGLRKSLGARAASGGSPPD